MALAERPSPAEPEPEPPTAPFTPRPAPIPTAARSVAATPAPAVLPVEDRGTNPIYQPGPLGAFVRSKFLFMTGIPAGEVAHVRGETGEIILAYRSFASVVGIVAALMAGIVLFAGFAALLFLMIEGRPLPALVAMILAAAFSIIIAMLVPTTNVTLYEGASPAITITQESNLSFPIATFAVHGRDGQVVGRLRKSVFSRMGRNRWDIMPADDPRPYGYAIEESFGRALMGKVAGKFDASFQSNMLIHYLDHDCGWIVRRPDAGGAYDYLDVSADTNHHLDRRMAVAVATLILGSEP